MQRAQQTDGKPIPTIRKIVEDNTNAEYVKDGIKQELRECDVRQRLFKRHDLKKMLYPFLKDVYFDYK